MLLSLAINETDLGRDIERKVAILSGVRRTAIEETATSTEAKCADNR